MRCALHSAGMRQGLIALCQLLMFSGSIVLAQSTHVPYKSSKPVIIPSEAAMLDDREAQFAQLAEDAALVERQQGLLRRVVKLVSPSIVHIEAIKETKGETSLTSSRSEPKRIEEAGAGVLVDIRNAVYVITNRHVIHSASLSAIKVETNDSSRLDVQNAWSDAATDIAVLQVSGRRLLPARLGDSTGVEMGDFVFAIGSPFGLSHSVTYGIISAKGRRNLELGTRAIDIQDFFQTDAAINPGNSGGPLMNWRGEVIGINTAIASNSGGNEGIGFSIPVNLVMEVATQLVAHGQLQRGYLGVVMDNQFDSNKAERIGLVQTRGALVKAVKPKSPADLAGLRAGDLILEFDGRSIENDGHLVQTVGLTSIGKAITVVIMRDGKKYQVQVLLTEHPPVY
jgi:serine protease Do